MSARPILISSPLPSLVGYTDLPSRLAELPNVKEANAAWVGLIPLLNRLGIWLCGTKEYQNNPPAPHKDPLDPFHTQDDENFIVFCTGDKAIRHSNDQCIFHTHRIGIDRFGRTVHLRATRPTSVHLKVLHRLARDHPWNRTVPVLSLVPLKNWVLINQPCWSPFWNFKMELSYLQLWWIMSDLLEGLVFMHEQGVAHGDIHCKNILSNTSGIGESAQTDPFFRVGYIDFGSAFIFPVGVTDHTVSHEQAETVPPIRVRAPEQSLRSGSWDAYAADIYNLGSVLKQNVVREDLTALDNLIARMTREDPRERISARAALSQFVNIVQMYPEVMRSLELRGLRPL